MKNAGPWEIIQVINNKAYEVKLPEHLERAGLTPIFHPSKLHLAPTDPYPGQYQDPQPPILITTGDADDEGHEEWEIDDILDCRDTKCFGVQYKATYRGHWDQWNAAPPWQPWTDFKLAAERIREFHAAHPDKPPAPSYFDAERTARETSP
jgi:hypothetical protein